MGNYDDPALTGRPTRRRWPIVAGVVAALLVGGGAGYGLRALTTTTATSAQATSTTAPPTTTSAPATSASCAAAGDAGAALVAQLQRAVQAIGNLDPGTLGDVLDQVQGLQGQLEDAVRGCTGAAAAQPG